MRRKIIVIIILLLFIIDLCLIWPLFLVKQVNTYEMDVYVTNSTENGFNLDTDKIHFGIMSNSSFNAYRDLIMSNPYNYSLKFNLLADGEMAGNVYYEKNDFILGPGENETVKVVFSRGNLEQGYYQGRTIVSVRRVCFVDFILESFL